MGTDLACVGNGGSGGRVLAVNLLLALSTERSLGVELLLELLLLELLLLELLLELPALPGVGMGISRGLLSGEFVRSRGLLSGELVRSLIGERGERKSKSSAMSAARVGSGAETRAAPPVRAWSSAPAAGSSEISITSAVGLIGSLSLSKSRVRAVEGGTGAFGAGTRTIFGGIDLVLVPNNYCGECTGLLYTMKVVDIY